VGEYSPWFWGHLARFQTRWNVSPAARELTRGARCHQRIGNANAKKHRERIQRNGCECLWRDSRTQQGQRANAQPSNRAHKLGEFELHRSFRHDRQSGRSNFENPVSRYPSRTSGAVLAAPEGPPVDTEVLSQKPSVRRKPLSKIARRVIASIIVVVAAIALWPAQYGGLTGMTVIKSESMQPTYFPGDLVVSIRLPEYQVGQVISYLVPMGQDGAGQRIIHRITEIDTSTGGPIYTTIGDNNFGAPDPWLIGPKDVMGTALFALPGFGGLIGGMANPLLIGLILAALVVVVLWSADPRDPSKRRKAKPYSAKP
jgi:signal peptidase I